MRSAATALALLLLGCGDAGPAGAGDPAAGTGPPAAVGALTVKPVQWNGKQVAVGKVSAVGEAGNDVAVFSDTGLNVFTSGLLLGSDNSVKTWQGAALIPAGDLTVGQWLLGIDGDGHLRHVKNRTQLEDVSDRYGLAGVMVHDATALGGARTAFALEGQVAVADGQLVTRYNLPSTGLVGGSGRAVTIAGGVVRIFHADTGTAQSLEVPGAVAAAVDPLGRLLLITQDSLYGEDDKGNMRLLYRGSGAPLRGLTVAGTGVWVMAGDSLLRYDSGQLRRSQAGVLPADARVFGSPSGDVWVLSGGVLTRLEEDTPGGADQDVWKQTVLPIFIRTCSLCHLPGGTSGIDLSSYQSWASRRDLVNRRVILGMPTPMPPAGAGMLTQDELDTVSAWIGSGPMSSM